jgi:hypothetical protein
MPDVAETERQWKAEVLLHGAAKTSVAQAVVQHSELLNSVREVVDVTPFGTKWRSFLSGRRRSVHKLRLHVALQGRVAAPTPNLVVRVTRSGAPGQPGYLCDVLAVSGSFEDRKLDVHTQCGDTTVFM